MWNALGGFGERMVLGRLRLRRDVEPAPDALELPCNYKAANRSARETARDIPGAQDAVPAERGGVRVGVFRRHIRIYTNVL